MTKEEYLALAESKYANITALNSQPTLLDFEVGFMEIWTELGREVAQANLGDPGKDRRGKKKLKASTERLK